MMENINIIPNYLHFLICTDEMGQMEMFNRISSLSNENVGFLYGIWPYLSGTEL